MIKIVASVDDDGFDPNSRVCVGKHTIPMDESVNKPQMRQFKPLTFTNLDIQPKNIVLTNDGRTLNLYPNYTKSQVPIISGGPLEDIGSYRFSRMYFYWMERSDSKYNYGNITFPAELHLVFLNVNLTETWQSLRRDNCVVVLAYPIKVVETSSNFFSEIVNHLPVIRDTDTFTNQLQDMEFALNSIIGKDTSNFYIYHGNMLSIACVRDITYIDFPTAVEVNLKFVEQISYMIAFDYLPLMKQINLQEPTKGTIIKSTMQSVNGPNGVAAMQVAWALAFMELFCIVTF